MSTTETLGPFQIDYDDNRIRIFQGDEKLVEMGFGDDVPQEERLTKAFARIAISSEKEIHVTNDVVMDAAGNLTIRTPVATISGQPIPVAVRGE